MIYKIKGKFFTDFYGSAPAIGAEGILKKWCEDKQNDWLLSWADQIKKKGQNAMEALEQILSVFHRDEKNNPILGAWMLRKCLIVTGQTMFNAQKDKSHPKKNSIPMGINLIDPIHINVFNSKRISSPDNIKTYTVSLTNRSFFKAYEVIKSGTTFEAQIHADEEILSKKHMDMIINKCGLIGVGAFRERFGKFTIEKKELVS